MILNSKLDRCTIVNVGDFKLKGVIMNFKVDMGLTRIKFHCFFINWRVPRNSLINVRTNERSDQ